MKFAIPAIGRTKLHNLLGSYEGQRNQCYPATIFDVTAHIAEASGSGVLVVLRNKA